jgi:hypothetical protein
MKKVIIISAALIILYIAYKKFIYVKQGEMIPTAKGSFNNPMNIKKSADVFKGEIDSASCCFKSFADITYGYRAGIKILQTYVNSYACYTITDIINRYAPASDNNSPQNYISYVCQAANITPDQDIRNDILSEDDVLVQIIVAMAIFEGDILAVNEADVENSLLI